MEGGGCGGCAAEVYESAQWNYRNGRYSSIRYLYSSFSETMPTGSLRRNGFDAEAAYDMFINGTDTDEVMVWVDNQGQTRPDLSSGWHTSAGRGSVYTFQIERIASF